MFRCVVLMLAALTSGGSAGALPAHGCPTSDQPMLVDKHGAHKAAAVVVILKTQITPWVSVSDRIVGYCFFGAANVIELDGRFYAVNGLSRSRVSASGIRCGREPTPLFDGYTAPKSIQAFSQAANSIINSACD